MDVRFVLYFPGMSRLLLTACLAVAMSACGHGGDADAGSDADAQDVPDVPHDTPVDPPEEPEGLAVSSCNPYHGPFVGGQEVVVRGQGFDDGAVVTFGGHIVEEADTTVEDLHRITVLTPANPPGPVEVCVQVGEEMACKDGAYTYDDFFVDPPQGSIAGGTYVSITGSGTEFDPEPVVTFDGREAVDVEWISPTLVTCRTPVGTVGPADVEIAGAATYFIREAYLYYNHADPTSGGLGGGPIVGSVNVTVLDDMTGDPVVGAYVILGTDGATAYQGHADMLGQITFSAPDLAGRQSVTAAQEGYETTTIEAFDATDVTILLYRIPEPEPGPLPPGRYGAVVQGELIFSHGGEFGPGPWEIIPDPDTSEEKVAFVYASGSSIFSPPPAPTTGGTSNEVLDRWDFAGEYGYRYSCFVRPGAVAIWALAGLRDTITNAFTPYAFGVARNVIAGPGEYVTGVHVYMTHELNTPLRIRLDDPPPIFSGDPMEPDVYKVDVFISLGGDGVIWREDRTRTQTGSTFFTFPGWLPLEGELYDATYTIVAGAYREDVDDLTGFVEYTNPYSVRVASAVTNVWEEILIGDFIGIPDQVDPEYAGVITDLTMAFTHDRTAPDFWNVQIQTYPDQVPLWFLILPGDMTSYTLPDLPTLAGLPEPPSGYSVWIVYGVESPGFVYDEWSYRYLSRYYWSAYSADAFLFQF